MARYDGPIVDAHQHFWQPDRNPHPWLRPGVQIPFRYGNYDAIKRRYLPDDYRRDAGRYRIVQTVYVETGWDGADTVSPGLLMSRRNGTQPTQSAKPAMPQACLSATDCQRRSWRRPG